MKPSPRLPGGPLFWPLAFIPWMGFAMVAVAGGILRVVWLDPRLGEHTANLVETLALALVLVGLVWLCLPWLLPRLEPRRLWQLGAFWFALTVSFEFLLGHFVGGASWGALLSNYDISEGRLWILVPITMGIGPAVIGRLLRRHRPPLAVDHTPRLAGRGVQ